MNRLEDSGSPMDSPESRLGGSHLSSSCDKPWGVSDSEEDDEEDDHDVPDYVPPAQVLPKQRSATRMSAMRSEEMLGLNQQGSFVDTTQPRTQPQRYSARSVFFPQAGREQNDSAVDKSLLDDSVKLVLQDVDDFDAEQSSPADTKPDWEETAAEYSYTYNSKQLPPGGEPETATNASSHYDDEHTGYSATEQSSALGLSAATASSEPTNSSAMLNTSSAPDRSGVVLPPPEGKSPYVSVDLDGASGPPALPTKPVIRSAGRSRSSSLSPTRNSLTLPNDLGAIMDVLDDDHDEVEQESNVGTAPDNSRRREGKTGKEPTPASAAAEDGVIDRKPAATGTSGSSSGGGTKLKNMFKAVKALAFGASPSSTGPTPQHTSGSAPPVSSRPSVQQQGKGITSVQVSVGTGAAGGAAKPPLLKTASADLGPREPDSSRSGASTAGHAPLLPPLSTNVPTTPIVPHSALVTSKLPPLSEFAVDTLVIMEGWLERKSKFFGWKKVYAVFVESVEHVCVLQLYEKMIQTNWGKIPLKLKAVITLNSIDSIETESHRYARGREFTLRRRQGSTHVGSPRPSSARQSPHMGAVVSPPPGHEQGELGGYDSDKNSVASAGSANSADSKGSAASVLSWFGKNAGSKDLHMRAENAETRLIWTVLMMKALELTAQ